MGLVSATAPQTRHTVTAIIVAHDGVELLPGLFRALATQTYTVERTVAADTGSLDHSVTLLNELVGPESVLSLPRGTGFGAAVAAALGHGAASRALQTDPDMRRVEWIWLLHDDCEPAPDALERMIKAASRDRSVGILGPKVLDAADRRKLRETGISIDRAGRRITGIEPGEIDQGQHDGNRETFAVGSAGMLIRRDVWDRLGGFDAHLEMFRDDLDFCWRAHGAGYRVHVVTDAVLYHRELSARRRRGDRAQRPRLRRLDRRNALYVLAVNLPLPQMLTVMAGCVAGSLLRAAWFVLTKQEDLAAAQAHGAAWLFLHPVTLWHARRRRAAGRRSAYDAVRSYIPPGRTVARVAENIAGLLSSGPPPITGGRHHAMSPDEGDEEPFIDRPSPLRRMIGNPGVQLFAVLTVIALVAERRLLGNSPLGGGALVPAWGGASSLWSEYLAAFHPVGLGTAASAPPYLAVVALLATVLGGQAWLAVDVLLLGCVPLAGITAYLAARRLVTAVPARLLLAASYAIAPVAIGAVAAGRLGTAVAFVLLPTIAVSAARMLTSPPRAARRAAWATGLLVALAAAFSPLIWAVAALLAVAAVVVRRWLWPVSRIDAAIVVLAPFPLLFPWSLHLLGSPSALLAEVGLPVGNAGPSLPAHQLLMLSPGGPGLPPFWVTVGLALAVASAFLSRGRPSGHGLITGTGWAVAAVGYLFAVVVSRTTVASASGGAAGAGGGWPGPALAITALGLLVAAAPAAQWLSELGRKPASVAALAAAASAPVLAAGFWLTGGVRGPVAPVTQPVLPAFAAALSAGPGQYRTLVIRPAQAAGGAADAGAVSYDVLRDSDPSLGEPELAGYGPAGQALSRQVAALVAADGADSGDPGETLGSFGIRWVLLPGPVNPLLEQRLDAASGLVPLSSAPAYDLWQVADTVSRVRVIASDGTVTDVPSQGSGSRGVPAPASGGTLVLAEPYGGWSATLNGTALKPLPKPVDGWAQGFVLPKGGGTLAISRDTTARTVSLVIQLMTLLVIAVLAIPGKREDPAEASEAIASVRAAQQRQRLARAERTRELTRTAAVRALESGVARRAAGGLASNFPPRGGSRATSPGSLPDTPVATPVLSEAADPPAVPSLATQSLPVPSPTAESASAPTEFAWPYSERSGSGEAPGGEALAGEPGSAQPTSAWSLIEESDAFGDSDIVPSASGEPSGPPAPVASAAAPVPAEPAAPSPAAPVPAEPAGRTFDLAPDLHPDGFSRAAATAAELRRRLAGTGGQPAASPGVPPWEAEPQPLTAPAASAWMPAEQPASTWPPFDASDVVPPAAGEPSVPPAPAESATAAFPAAFSPAASFPDESVPAAAFPAASFPAEPDGLTPDPGPGGPTLAELASADVHRRVTGTGEQPVVAQGMAPWEADTNVQELPTASYPPSPGQPEYPARPESAVRPERPRSPRPERGAHRAGRHGKPRGRRKGRDRDGES